MKRITFLLFILFCFVKGQDLKFDINYGFSFHMEGTTNENPDIPKEIQSIKQAPAFSAFVDNNTYYSMGLAYKFKSLNKGKPFLKFQFGISKLTNNVVESELIIGESINIYSYRLCAGYEFLTENKVFGPNLYSGISLKKYKGSSKFENIRVENNYDLSPFLILGGSIDLNVDPYTYGISVGVDIEIGSAKRGDLKFYSDDDLIGTAHPTGDMEIEDNTISIYCSFYYNHNLGDEK